MTSWAMNLKSIDYCATRIKVPISQMKAVFCQTLSHYYSSYCAVDIFLFINGTNQHEHVQVIDDNDDVDPLIKL